VKQQGISSIGVHAGVQGTDAYNAPERSNKADMRKADVWALGCVLYELFSGGERLFKWETEQQKFMQLASLYNGWALPQLPANVAAWQEVVDAMLALDPEERPLPRDVLKMGLFGCDAALSALVRHA
jgi:serine/threonine protein kinase